MLLMLLFWYPVLNLILAICVFVLAMVADSTLNAKYITIYKGICRVMNKYRKQQRQNYLVFYQVLHRTNKALDRRHNKQYPQHASNTGKASRKDKKQSQKKISPGKTPSAMGTNTSLNREAIPRQDTKDGLRKTQKRRQIDFLRRGYQIPKGAVIQYEIQLHLRTKTKGFSHPRQGV